MLSLQKMTWLLGILLIITPISADEQLNSSIRAKWQQLFAHPQPHLAEKQIDAILQACGNNVETIKLLIASDKTYPAFKAGWYRRATKVADKGKTYDVEFFVRVPAGYIPSKSYPLVIIAHGTGGNGRDFGRQFVWRLGNEAEKYIILAPTLPGPKVFNARAYQEETYLKPLNWVRLNLNIDDDRIYISGYSQGGHVTWHMATMYPHLFAAAVPMAGVPWFEGGLALCNSYFENVKHLPIWAIWGELDKVRPDIPGDVDLCRAAAKRMKELGNTNFIPGEIPGGRHGDCWPKRGKLAAFFASHKRNPMPVEFAHFFHLQQHRRGYYIEAIKLMHTPVDFSKKPRIVVHVRPGQRITPKQATEYVRKYYEKLMFKMWGRLDKQNNTLSIHTKGISAVRIYVMDGMFDFNKPVTLRWGARVWRGKVPCSAKCILTHYAATRDATALICNEIDFYSSGRAIVRFK